MLFDVSNAFYARGRRCPIATDLTVGSNPTLPPSLNYSCWVTGLSLQAGSAVKKSPGLGVGSCLLAACVFGFFGCSKAIEDEAKVAGLTTKDFPQTTADIFKSMDGGMTLTPDEIMGRNTWNLWSGGNQHFWNHVAQDSYGLMDLLKMLDNRKYPRGERFKTLGLSNEPGFRAATKPDRVRALAG